MLIAVLFYPFLSSNWLFRNSPLLLVSTLPFILIAYRGDPGQVIFHSGTIIFPIVGCSEVVGARLKAEHGVFCLG